MSMTFFFSKVRERPATRQHPCANNNGYGFQNEQIANRCFFSVINRHNVCEQKKKKKLFGEWKTWPTWFDEFFLREIGRKKKKKETLSVGIPSCANHTVRHQKHNFTSRLDKKLKRAPQKQNNWKKKKREIQTPCHCTGWKSVQTWRWAKDSRLRAAAALDPRNIDNPSVWMSYWSAPLCCHTHPLLAPRKLKKANNHKMYVSDGCERALHRSRFPMQTAPKFQAMQVTCCAWQCRKKKRTEREGGRYSLFSRIQKTARNVQQFCAISFTNMQHGLEVNRVISQGGTKWLITRKRPSVITDVLAQCLGSSLLARIQIKTSKHVATSTRRSFLQVERNHKTLTRLYNLGKPQTVSSNFFRFLPWCCSEVDCTQLRETNYTGKKSHMTPHQYREVTVIIIRKNTLCGRARNITKRCFQRIHNIPLATLAQHRGPTAAPTKNWTRAVIQNENVPQYMRR